MNQKKSSRESVRGKVRGKREEVRKAADAKRAAVRDKVRGAAGMLFAAFGLSFAFGCATADPTSKQARTEANRNVTTINNYVGMMPAGSNGLAVAGGVSACGAGGFSIVIHDLNGTIAQSADTAGNESVDQAAVPTLQAGLTGDKAIEETAGAVKTLASGGTSTAAGAAGTLVQKGVESVAGGGAASAAGSAAASGSAAAPAAADAVKAADCPEGECAEAAAK